MSELPRLNYLAIFFADYLYRVFVGNGILATRLRNIVVKKILKQNGFTVKKEKTIYYTPQTSQTEKIITGVRIVAGRVSAPLDYISALQEELREAIVKSKSRHPQGDFGTRQHYRGQIGYIMWLDRPVGERLLKLYRKVKWRRLEWI